MRRIRIQQLATPRPLSVQLAEASLLAEQVALGLAPDTLRVSRSLPAVCFGPRDAAAPGYPSAIAAATALGFDVTARGAGGRAVAFHEDVVILDWIAHDLEPRARVRDRFVEAASVIAGGLARLGVEARIGAIPGEYCPGEFSVSAGGRHKLAGLAQRVHSRANHLGAAIVVGRSERLCEVLTPVYAALGIEWDPATLGGVCTDAPAVRWCDVSHAIVESFAERYAVHAESTFD